MNIQEIEKLGTYSVVMHEDLPDIHAEGWILRHKKSGARVMLIPAEDDNKVFNIAFRTPPEDSTGVAHINEHSVLCGSKKFPLKDPFVELVKGSLNTFLNAMTYPDKTMYPVASTNDADFRNLMDVYLDAVFHPHIYEEPNIFRQEGWHYHLENKEDPITYNGVVYNEMKGAFSTPDDYLERVIFNALFPDTAYGVESGGDPEHIPDLTYEQFLAFHARFYHPSNSYIYLYGDMDMADTLDFIDKSYLSAYEEINPDSEIGRQDAFEKMAVIREEYPIADEEDEAANTYLTWNVVAGDPLDVKEMIACDALDYALFSMPGAPVRQALLDAGVGKDIDSMYSDGILQPYFSLTARNAEEDQADEFVKIIRDVLAEQVKKGIDRKSLNARINYLEFQFREADYSTYPKGLIYGIDVFDTWLYDEERSFASLRQLDAYESLRKELDGDYFEQMVQDKILNNPHAALVILAPRKGLQMERDRKTAEKLAAFKASLTEEEIDRLARETRELKAYQEKTDTPEDKECLPVLRREDIRREARALSNVVMKAGGEFANGIDPDIIFHLAPSNGIGYAELFWDIHNVPMEEVPYLGFLKAVLANVSTADHSYTDLTNEINANTGGIVFGISIYDDLKSANASEYKVYFSARGKALYGKMGRLFDFIREIITTSEFTDSKRIYEILAGVKASLQMSMQSAGHATAASRAAAYYSSSAAFSDKMSGIGYYRFIKDLEENYEEKKEELKSHLKFLLKAVFDPKNLLVSYTAEEEGLDVLRENLPKMIEGIDNSSPWSQKVTAEPLGRLNEAFSTAGQVQYVAQCGNYLDKGIRFHGAMNILRQIMGYGYLWQNVRVQGGAYGCGASFKRAGDALMTSFRDPHLLRTLGVFAGIPDYLRDFDADEKEMTKFIIGTISGIDTPLTPSLYGMVSMRAYMNGLTYEDSQKMRDEILDATAEDIRALAKAMEAVLSDNYICVVGSEGKIAEHKELFSHVETLN
ncbi:MAG: insulinase family protein [Lachnospiraceae bacterium]|nr:insulinase family protein [Lachnospiraceae bacterium]